MWQLWLYQIDIEVFRHSGRQRSPRWIKPLFLFRHFVAVIKVPRILQASKTWRPHLVPDVLAVAWSCFRRRRSRSGNLTRTVTTGRWSSLGPAGAHFLTKTTSPIEFLFLSNYHDLKRCDNETHFSWFSNDQRTLWQFISEVKRRSWTYFVSIIIARWQ